MDKIFLKCTASISANGSGPQQVFSGTEKSLEKNSSIYIASLFFAIKNPKNDDNHFLEELKDIPKSQLH